MMFFRFQTVAIGLRNRTLRGRGQSTGCPCRGSRLKRCGRGGGSEFGGPALELELPGNACAYRRLTIRDFLISAGSCTPAAVFSPLPLYCFRACPSSPLGYHVYQQLAYHLIPPRRW